MMPKEHEAVRNTRRSGREDARSNQFNVTAAQTKQSVEYEHTVQLRKISCTYSSL